MGLDLKYEKGQTPLDDDEKEGLLIKSIATREELDEAEQLNIEQAIEWTLRRKFDKGMVLTEKYINDLHARMYGNVWGWAGNFRKSNKNIGIDKLQIPMALRQLIDDCKYWIERNAFPADEIAIRFKHRIVNIHCYPNGNGRHSRLMGDVIISHLLGGPVFTWGSSNLVTQGDTRERYLEAIWAADGGEFEALLKFARS